MTKFSAQLRKIRKEKGKKLKDVAAALSVALRTYQGYEGGTNEPNIEKLIALADYFDVSLDYLMGRTDH